MRHSLTIIASVLGYCGVAGAQLPSGTIAGIVLDGNARIVPTAQVVYSKQAEFSRDSQGRAVRKDVGFVGKVAVNPDGTFLIGNLPSGRYSVCAHGSAPTSLTGCAWESTPVVSLRDGENLTVTRRVFDGAVVTFRVYDANGTISMPDEKGRVITERRFFIGVVSPSGSYHAAKATPSTAPYRLFRVTVPKQQSFRLFVDTELTVTNAAGDPIERRQPSSMLVSAGTLSDLTVDLNVR